MAKETQSNRLWRLSSMGFTFVSMIIAGGLLGWALAWMFGSAESERTYIVTGAVIGIVYGMVDFIRDALRAVKEDQS
ncbi:MAG: F0F1-type ATP synthase assembly protein I [Phycisphaerales bacterium]|jgi:F0F1-type ATP synthase assembly protein I